MSLFDLKKHTQFPSNYVKKCGHHRAQILLEKRRLSAILQWEVYYGADWPFDMYANKTHKHTHKESLLTLLVWIPVYYELKHQMSGMCVKSVKSGCTDIYKSTGKSKVRFNHYIC